jgi:hypothetical protein
MANTADDVVDLDAPLATLAGRPIGNKKAKLAAIELASADRAQASIDKCLADVSAHLLIRGEKSDERWKSLLSKQDEKIVIEKERVDVEKRKEDFMILTADTSQMDDEVKAAHMFYRGMILQEIAFRRAVVTASAAAAA